MINLITSYEYGKKLLQLQQNYPINTWMELYDYSGAGTICLVKITGHAPEDSNIFCEDQYGKQMRVFAANLRQLKQKPAY